MNRLNLDTILDKRLDKDFLIQLFQEQKEVHTSAIHIALSNQEPQAWRATWILAHCTKKNDSRIQPFLNQFIEVLSTKKDGHQREILKILEKMQLDDEQEGRVFDVCMTLWENIAKAPAVRYLAFKNIYKICEKYPELSGELAFISQEHYIKSLSPGIQKIIRRMIAN